MPVEVWLKINKIMKKRYLVLGLSFVLLFSALNVSAAEFLFPKKDGGSITINKESENVYAAGNVVSINSNIKKGLYAVGNTVNLNADVDGSFHAGGGTVMVKGNVSGTVHAGGGNIFIEGMIGDDLFVGGGSVFIAETSSIGGDLVAGAGSIVINGPIGGNILLGGREAVINSRVAGNVKIKADKLELGDNAEIAGNLEYTSEKKAEIDESKVLGVITFHQKEVAKAGPLKNSKIFLGLLTLGFLLKLLGSIVIGLILVYLLKKFTGEVVKGSLRKFWTSLGIGFGFLILVPIACILLAISVIGLWIAGIVGALYVLLLILSSAFAGIILGTWLIKILAKKSEYAIDWRAVVVGVAVMKILIFIPFVGWLAKFIFFLIGLGALVQWLYKKLR